MKASRIAVLLVAFCATIFAAFNGVDCGASLQELMAMEESAATGEVSEAQMDAEIAQIVAEERGVEEVAPKEEAKTESELKQAIEQKYGDSLKAASLEEAKSPQFLVHFCRTYSTKMECGEDGQQPNLCTRSQALLDHIALKLESGGGAQNQMEKAELKPIKKEVKSVALAAFKTSLRLSRSCKKRNLGVHVRAKRRGIYEDDWVDCVAAVTWSSWIKNTLKFIVADDNNMARVFFVRILFGLFIALPLSIAGEFSVHLVLIVGVLIACLGGFLWEKVFG